MKKIFKTLAIVAVAALGFACQNDIDEQVNGNEGEKVTVEVVASTSGTRSAFVEKVGNAYTSTWSKDQVVYFAPYQPAVGADPITMSDATVAATGDEATFSVDFTQTQDNGAILAFSPIGEQYGAGGFTSDKVYGSANPYIWLNLPAEQATSATSCDEQVHVLYASKEYSGGFPTSVNMGFNHVLAYGKMTIKGFEGEIASVDITFPEVVAGGSVKYFYLTNTFDGASANTITVTNNVGGNKDIWFGIVPTESGEEKMSGKMTVVVTDGESNTYTKELDTIGKLAFIQGQVSAFTVNMEGIAADGAIEQPNVENAWNLVTDASILKAGMNIIIAAAGDVNYALSTTQKSNNRDQAEITKDATNNTLRSIGDAQILTLEAGNVADTWAFNTGDGYLYAASSESNHLRTETTLSDNSSWSVSIADGVASIVAQGTNTRNVMQYNQTSGLFACYSGASQAGVAIYYYNGKLPVVANVNAVVASNYENTVTGTTATIASSYTLSNAAGDEVVTAGFEYKTGVGEWNSVAGNLTDKAFSANLTGLTAETEYTVRAWITIDGGEKVYGAEATFTPTKEVVVEGVDNAWNLVSSASVLKAGMKVVIVAANSNVAMSTTQNDKNRGQVTITKDNDNKTLTFDTDVQVFTLDAGTVDGTWAFNTGDGYIYAASSSANNLKTQATNNDNGSWNVTIAANGVATIKAQGTYTRNWLRYNSQSSLFSCYSSGQADVAIYYFKGDYQPGQGGGGTPDPDPGQGGGETPTPGQTSTVEMTTFSATSATMDSVISYACDKGGGTSAPVVNGGEIRLYQKGSGQNVGGNIIIRAADGYKIQSITIGSSMGTTLGYGVDNANATVTDVSLAANGKHTLSDLSAESVSFHCYGTSSSSRLYVNYLSVTYVAE